MESDRLLDKTVDLDETAFRNSAGTFDKSYSTETTLRKSLEKYLTKGSPSDYSSPSAYAKHSKTAFTRHNTIRMEKHTIRKHVKASLPHIMLYHDSSMLLTTFCTEEIIRPLPDW